MSDLSLRLPPARKGAVFLAPMAGVNDPMFRAICKRLGADLTYTEMVSAKALEYKNLKTKDMLLMLEEEKPVAVQLFGKDPLTLAEQARALEDSFGGEIALIDLNMGCPSRKIAGKGEGAALMRDFALAERILRFVVEAVSLPVSVKFRKGYEHGEDIAVEFALMAEACGVTQIAVHGRTARQQFHGVSDRELIKRVKAAVSIPVIASGDVYCAEDIRSYLEDYGADAVMVARGAQGNPWIFASRQPLLEERVAVAREHAQGLSRLLPHRLASMRKHIAWYFKGCEHASAIRRAVQSCIALADYERLLDQILAWE